MPSSIWPIIIICMLCIGSIAIAATPMIENSMLTKNTINTPRNFPMQIMIALTILNSAYIVMLAAASGSNEA